MAEDLVLDLEGESEGMEDVAPLFAQRGEVGADGAEGRTSGRCLMERASLWAEKLNGTATEYAVT